MRDVLRSLYIEHAVRPGAIFVILGAAKMWETSALMPNWGARHLRQILPSKKRKALAGRLIDDAVDLKLLGDFFFWNFGQSFAETDTACTQMHRMAQLLLSDEIKFLPRNSNASRNNELNVVRRVCAKRLCEFFSRIAGQPKHRIVGRLVRTVFPNWPHRKEDGYERKEKQENLDDRAENLVKKWMVKHKKGSFDPVVSDAMVVQEQDEVYLNRWREFRVQWVKVLQESETKLKDKHDSLIQQGIEAKFDPEKEIVITDKEVVHSDDFAWRTMVSRLRQGKRPFSE